MTSGKKVGRKRRAFKATEKLLMERFSVQLDELLSKPRMSIQAVAKDLGICRASLYKYRNEELLPPIETLRLAHRLYGFDFPYIDFDEIPDPKVRQQLPIDAQGFLPFFEPLTTDNFKIIKKKTVERENALELTIQIRLTS